MVNIKPEGKVKLRLKTSMMLDDVIMVAFAMGPRATVLLALPAQGSSSNPEIHACHLLFALSLTALLLRSQPYNRFPVATPMRTVRCRECCGGASPGVGVPPFKFPRPNVDSLRIIAALDCHSLLPLPELRPLDATVMDRLLTLGSRPGQPEWQDINERNSGLGREPGSACDRMVGV